jgi:hypothetical protein
MFKSAATYFSLIIIASLLFACKPTRKSYLPYRKRNKCGCPTYGFQKNTETHTSARLQAQSKKLFQ